MATLEKLMKAFEILKVHPNTFVEDGQSVKKKDVPVNKKDKITQCSMIADAICSQNLRSVSDFPKYLGIAMETFLSFCDDEDSDIRMVADECLNKTIKSLLESHLGRLQVELYKEIKKETSARRLRAALSRFADLCHLIRPQKCRAYTVNLIPCLNKICHYKEESVQETLSIAIGKIMPVLGKFTNDGEIKMLLKAFLPNLSSESAVTRRTAATSLVTISHHSRKPLVSYVWLLSALLDHLIPVNRDHPVYLILGVLLCIRHLIPHLSEKSAQPTVVLRGSIGVTMKEEEVNVNDDQLIQVYELLLHYTRHQDHNVITASLEALQQLFKTTPQPLLTILLSSEGIQRSYIYSSDSLVASRLRADSQILPTPSTDEDEATLDDEPFSVDLNTEENLANSCETLPITDSGVPSEDFPHDSRSCASFDGDDMSDYSSSNVGQNLDGRWSPFTSPGVHLKIDLRKVPKQLKSTNSEEKLLEMDDSQDIVSAASSPGMNSIFRVGNIGSFTDRNVPLCYCARLLSSSFLLSGGQGGLMPDRSVRVSIKSLAVSCLAGILNLYPKAFFLDLDVSVTDQFLIQERAQKVWDVMHYTQHHDPHLRGHTALLLGSLLKYGLREAGGSWEKWAKTLTSSIDTPTLETILMSLLEVSQDESSVATRLGLSALKLCLKTILSLAPAYMGLKLLEVLLSLKDNPYWLVKVELMELVCEVPFAVVNQMQNSIQSHHHHYHYRDQNTQMTGHLQPRTPSYQDRFLNEVLMHLLSDEDFRVRQAAANSIVKVIPYLFFAIDHAHHDPVVAIARQEMDKFLNVSNFDQSARTGPLVHGLVKPFDLHGYPAANAEVQGALSRVLSQLVNLLYTSTNKFLTFGCCHTLCELSNEYPPTLYTQAWSYVSGERTSSVKPSTTAFKGATQTPEVEPLQESDLLFHLLVLVTSTPIALDLLSHQHILHLIGNILSGSCYFKIQAQVKTSSEGSIEESKWTISKDPSLSKAVEKLLSHLIRLLNMFTLVIEEQVPVHQTKSSLPSLPNAPNLSPMKRNKSKSKDDQSSGGSLGSSLSSFKGSPHRQASHDHKNSEGMEKDRLLGSSKSGASLLGHFILQPLYVKLYDLLKATHSSYKISMDFGSVDKFRGLLKVTLDVLSQILEVSTLEEMGSHAEELLTYSKSVMSMEACSAIKCVRQLLKCLFGTNLLSLWEEPQNSSKTTGAGRKPGRATRLSTSLSNASANQAPGLYHTCFTSPYTLFTQSITTSSLKMNTLNTDTDLGSWLSWMRKRSEMKLSNTLKGGNKSDVSSLAAHIRLFEPVVIKALKLYTIASSVDLQCEVLHILAQLVQLRVNYCLLDSDEIFINFVIKQFEYIEEGQILQLDSLIPSIFCFLVLLSYERYHSKSIISVSKIIQLCDGLIASGQPPQLCAIPALRPIVEDLFLLRGSNKLDSGKELDAQREVIVSVLLRFVQYPEVLDMFLLILHQCFKEGEDRWKKLSRLVVDTVLPFLARQQIQLDNQNALDTLHQLFEAVAPSVFRPVDILLKVLFATPQDLRNINNLQRWMCLVLSLLRVLLVQAKEEVALSRLGDLGLPMTIPKYSAKLLEPVLPLPVPVFADPLHGNPHPEYTIARFLFQVVGVLAEAIHSHTFSPLLRHQEHVFLCQQMSHLLLYLMHMFQSGIFRKVTNSAMNIIKPESSKIDIELPPNGVQSFYSVEEINQVFLDIAPLYPTLVLQWCNILILLNYENQGYWIQILRTVVRRPAPSSPSPKYLCDKLSQTPNSYSLEVVRRGGLILMCDYVCENLNDAEQMTWLIINHVSDLVLFSREPPVQDFISAIHRNSAASGLFVQAIQARCEDISKPSFLQRTLKCLEAIHLSQSGTLLTLIVDKFLCSHNLSLSRSYGQLACRRLQMLLDELARDPNQQQLPLEDIEKLLDLLSEPSIHNRHIELVNLLKQLRAVVSGVSASASLDFETNSEKDTELLGVKINREWFLEEVRSQCFKSGTSLKECASLLSKLTYEDSMAIMNLKGFHLPILQQCLLLGAKQITIRDSRLLPSASNSELVSPSSSLPEGANPNDPETPLYSATKTTLLRHVTQIIETVPRPHQVFLLRNDTSTPRESKYRAKLTELFQDSFFWDNLFQVADAVATYLLTIRKMPGHWEVPVDNLEDIARLGILCSEAVLWMLESKQKASCENIYTSLNTLDLILKNSSLAAVIGLQENMTWSCTAIAALYNFVLHCKQDLSNVKFPSAKDDGTNQEHIKAQLACTQMAQLIRWLEQAINDGVTLAIPSFIMTRIRNLIAGLSRIPFVNSFARTPPILWQLGWQPDIGGEFKTIIPPPPGEFLQERDVLMQYIYRVNLLGWTSRQQFEETWMSLLTVLSATPLADHEAEDEDQERILASCMAVKSITALLLHTLLLPQTGNPHSSVFLRQPRDKPLAFLHTRCGKKLQVVRTPLHLKILELLGLRDDMPVLGSNTEKVSSRVSYSMGQVSLEYLCVAASLLEEMVEHESSSSSSSSPSHVGSILGGAASYHQREQSLAASGLDIHSCLHFLLDLYSQWLSTQSCSRTPLVLLTEVARSVVMLSDIFMERIQYEWMLDTLLELHRIHPAEDEVIAQYLMYGICKAAAVLNMDQEMLEKLKKIVDVSLKSTYLPTRIATLYGLLYLLEQGGGDESYPLLSTAMDYLNVHLDHSNFFFRASSANEDHILIMWALAFYIIENYQDRIADNDFGQKMFQLSLNVCSAAEESVPTSVYLAVFHGLERLLVADLLNAKEAEMVVKLSVDRIKQSSPPRALAALGVLFSCMYIGKGASGLKSSDTNQNIAGQEDLTPTADPEQLIAAMERVTAIFDRVKRGLPFESEVIIQVLPSFLMEFFPAQDVLNKVIGEFVSSQQPYPQLLSGVLYQVFEHLHHQHQEELIHDWVLLSLSNFAQRSPLSMAVWSLTCCFVSASNNPLCRSMFPHIQNRMGSMETRDKKLFCLAGLEFRNQLTSKEQKASFKATIASVSHFGSPYTDLLALL